MEYGLYENTEKTAGLRLRNGLCLRVEAVREDLLRFIYAQTIEELAPEKETASLLVEAAALKNGRGRFTGIAEENGKLIATTKKLRLEIGLSDGGVRSFDLQTGEALLEKSCPQLSKTTVLRYTTDGEAPVIERRKTVDGERNFIKNLKETADHEAYRAKLCLTFEKEEGIYGFGQAEEGFYNYRGRHQYLYQHNMRIPMPVLYSDRGYGLLFDCCSLMTFQDDCDGSYVYLDAVEKLDYYLLAGGSPDKVIDGLRYLTGKAAMLPKWAFGYIQSKEQYYTAKELADVVRRYRELRVPLDGVVQDWNTWEPGNWGEKLVDKRRYGDLKERMQEIREMNAHAMVSVWPNMNAGGKNHREFMEAGYLLQDYATYDAFDENARAMYFKQAKEDLFDGGFEAWWCDSTEPFSGPDWGGEVKREPWERFCLVGGEHKKYLPQEKANAYALLHAKGIFENQRNETERIRVLNLTRSGYASGQKYAAMLWSGDTYASYETLKKQITEGLNMGLSGYPYWTLDIGAFFTVGEKWQNRGCGCNEDPTKKWFWQGEYDEGVHDRAYCELYVRWLQLGTFLPMFRSHGTDTPREIWNFGGRGEPFYDAIERFIRLRYRLMPYIYSMAGMVRLHNETMMRSLLFDFSFDKYAREIHDEFLFGRSLLICPVTEAMYYAPGNRPLEKEKYRTCYLPSGTDWYDYFTGEKYYGGQEYRVRAEIDRIPVFVRAGSILPMKEGMQYASDKEDAPVELHLYPGADADYTLYEDAGNDYAYEAGGYSLIPVKWQQAGRTLQIGKREGRYETMQAERDFILFLLEKEVARVHYAGEALTVLIPGNPED